jgi:hypothetical protein
MTMEIEAPDTSSGTKNAARKIGRAQFTLRWTATARARPTTTWATAIPMVRTIVTRKACWALLSCSSAR